MKRILPVFQHLFIGMCWIGRHENKAADWLWLFLENLIIFKMCQHSVEICITIFSYCRNTQKKSFSHEKMLNEPK